MGRALLVLLPLLSAAALPVAINTWFANANQLTYDMLIAGYTALDSVEAGCTLCEDVQW